MGTRRFNNIASTAYVRNGTIIDASKRITVEILATGSQRANVRQIKFDITRHLDEANSLLSLFNPALQYTLIMSNSDVIYDLLFYAGETLVAVNPEDSSSVTFYNQIYKPVIRICGGTLVNGAYSEVVCPILRLTVISNEFRHETETRITFESRICEIEEERLLLPVGKNGRPKAGEVRDPAPRLKRRMINEHQKNIEALIKLLDEINVRVVADGGLKHGDNATLMEIVVASSAAYIQFICPLQTNREVFWFRTFFACMDGIRVCKDSDTEARANLHFMAAGHWRHGVCAPELFADAHKTGQPAQIQIWVKAAEVLFHCGRVYAGQIYTVLIDHEQSFQTLCGKHVDHFLLARWSALASGEATGKEAWRGCDGSVTQWTTTAGYNATTRLGSDWLQITFLEPVTLKSYDITGQVARGSMPAEWTLSKVRPLSSGGRWGPVRSRLFHCDDSAFAMRSMPAEVFGSLKVLSGGPGDVNRFPRTPHIKVGRVAHKVRKSSHTPPPGRTQAAPTHSAHAPHIKVGRVDHKVQKSKQASTVPHTGINHAPGVDQDADTVPRPPPSRPSTPPPGLRRATPTSDALLPCKGLLDASGIKTSSFKRERKNDNSKTHTGNTQEHVGNVWELRETAESGKWSSTLLDPYEITTSSVTLLSLSSLETPQNHFRDLATVLKKSYRWRQGTTSWYSHLTRLHYRYHSVWQSLKLLACSGVFHTAEQFFAMANEDPRLHKDRICIRTLGKGTIEIKHPSDKINTLAHVSAYVVAGQQMQLAMQVMLIPDPIEAVTDGVYAMIDESLDYERRLLPHFIMKSQGSMPMICATSTLNCVCAERVRAAWVRPGGGVCELFRTL
ncbi:hypothetical protein T492DRAFT_839088 [Pavlovales sp. CCMP2436]|nr:hypothetical protein T492DRAFT_839088 [Pavlovales sp. CCMP2436]